MVVPANDSAAGFPATGLTSRDRNLFVRPPIIDAGKAHFEKMICFTDRIPLRIISPTPGATIHYTLDGSEPTAASPVFREPVPLTRSANVRAIAVRENRQSVLSPSVTFKRISGVQGVDLTPDPMPEYAASGPLTLVDGERGGAGSPSEHWLGFEGEDVEVLVDLGGPRTISSVSAGFLRDQRRWVFLPSAVEISLGAQPDRMKTVYRKDLPVQPQEEPAVVDVGKRFAPVRARFLRVRARNIGPCPPWHSGAGGKSWIFIDEILLR
jgi:hexosaminidase